MICNISFPTRFKKFEQTMSIFKYYQYQPQYYKKYFPLFLGYCEDSRFGSCHNVDPEVPNNFSRHFAKEKVPAAVILSSD